MKKIKITNKSEYYSVMSQIEILLQKGFSNLTKKEEVDLEFLSQAAEAWELNEYPMPAYASITDILEYIMREQRINQSEFSEQLDISKSLLSEILNGKKDPNLNLLKALHNKYQVDGNLLLELV
jgi:HTH-type transcriptional regulator/antitoxin HigA